jgi:FkbM family methyltransferase
MQDDGTPSRNVRAVSPEEIVDALYRGLLGREPDPGGLAEFAGALNAGVPLVDVVREVGESAERLAFEARRRPVLPPWTESPELLEGAGEVVVVDVGAQPLAGEEDVHAPLAASGRVTVVGFDPVEGVAETRRGEGWVLVPQAVGDGRRRTFHEAAWSPTSSLYTPDLDVMGDLEGLVDICRTVATREVDTVRLDDALAGVADRVDLLKLDVQGAELDVLRGAETVLGATLVVHAEVELAAIYQGQPLLGDVADHLRTCGFDVFDLPRLERYRYVGGVSGWPARRLVWAEAVFVPTRHRLDRLDQGATLRLARVMHTLYAAPDFCSWVLDRYDNRADTAWGRAYRRLLGR